MTTRSRSTTPSVAHARPSEVERSATTEYWNAVAAEWQYTGHERTWRMVSDAVNVELLKEWLEPGDERSTSDVGPGRELNGVSIYPDGRKWRAVDVAGGA